jgi:hypothetical protein
MTTQPSPMPEFERLIRIEAKLDAWNLTATAHETRSDQIHQDHESRIRKLERSVWLMAGAAAAVGGGAGALLAPVIGSG